MGKQTRMHGETLTDNRSPQTGITCHRWNPPAPLTGGSWPPPPPSPPPNWQEKSMWGMESVSVWACSWSSGWKRRNKCTQNSSKSWPQCVKMAHLFACHHSSPGDLSELSIQTETFAQQTGGAGSGSGLGSSGARSGGGLSPDHLSASSRSSSYSSIVSAVGVTSPASVLQPEAAAMTTCLTGRNHPSPLGDGGRFQPGFPPYSEPSLTGRASVCRLRLQYCLPARIVSVSPPSAQTCGFHGSLLGLNKGVRGFLPLRCLHCS